MTGGVLSFSAYGVLKAFCRVPMFGTRRAALEQSSHTPYFHRPMKTTETFWHKSTPLRFSLCTIGMLSAIAGTASAAVFSLSIAGSDAIFLAGRTDLTIPAANEAWTGPGDFLARHGGPTPEEIKETVPQFIPVSGSDVVKVADPAVGGISFFNGLGAPLFGPSGNGPTGSSLSALGGISGYKGPQGALTGVFLDDSVPSSGAPATLDFGPGGLGTDFSSLTPALGQVFYIGDGITSGSAFQEFIAPTGATRLFLGIPDGFGFNGPPGAYDDNDGAYRIRLGVNDLPTGEVPEGGATLVLLGMALAAMGAASRHSRRAGR